MDTNTVIALGTIALAGTALVAAIISVMAMLRQSKQTKTAIEVDVLLRLDGVWRSDRMIGVRAVAGGALLHGKNNSSVDEVLDFWESIAILLKRGVLDEEITWHTFYWSMANYWLGSQEYVRHVRADEGQETWKDLEYAFARLRAIETRKNGASSVETPPLGEQTVRFLQDETELASGQAVQGLTAT